MKVKLWGVRGSIPTTGPDTEKYGGNTSCASVMYDDHVLVLDGGTGIRQCGTAVSNYKRIDILLTHLHLDHIQGLGFFMPLFDPSKEVHIWGPASSSQSLFSRISRYLSPPLFPVLLRDVPCKLELHEVSNSDFDIGPFRVRSSYIIHPGPTVGYRIMRENFVFTYIPTMSQPWENMEWCMIPNGFLVLILRMAPIYYCTMHNTRWKNMGSGEAGGILRSLTRDYLLLLCRQSILCLLIMTRDIPMHFWKKCLLRSNQLRMCPQHWQKKVSR
jgi:hypothetical protein